MNTFQQQELLSLARASILHGLQQQSALPTPQQNIHDELHQPRACFVTLQKQGRLRGCIGQLQASQPLVDEVCVNAYSAAFQDPRFPPLSETELAQIDIEISVLGESEALDCDHEQQLLEMLRPGIDGVIVQEGSHSATYLPSVWRQLPEPGEFIAELKQKAGLAADYWSETIKFSRYRTEAFSEQH